MEEGRVLLANRLKDLCKEKGISYQELAEKADMSVKRVYRLASGMTADPGVFTMMSICDALGVTLDEFFGTEEFKAFRK